MKLKLDKILDVISISVTIIFNIYIYILTRSQRLSFIIGLFSIFMIVSLYIYKMIYKRYSKNIFIKLSDMLSAIIDMKEETFFSMIEDSLFSKLQYQTIKLTSILKNKNNEIEKERNEIQQLISDIAHQLKTPLTNLQMYGEFLQDESLSKEERNEFSKIIGNSLNRLSFLVESMIKMSRLESGVISLKPTVNELNDTILVAINQVQRKAKAKNIEITLEATNKVVINYDKNWMEEGIFNILENAVKYSSENGIINIKVQSYEMFVRIDIKDSGTGIEEEELPKIFGRFYRGRNAADTEGIGIGLYLTREIVSKHDGYIKVESTNKGSIFSVFLPNKN